VLSIISKYFVGISRKGQAEGASSLILMIALFLVVYMILLPVGEKREILGEPPIITNTQVPVGDQVYAGSGFVNLLTESPGLMKPFIHEVMQTNLASVNLFSLENQVYESIATNLVLESSILSEDKAEFTFYVEDLDNLKDIRLLFFVLDSKGELEVKFNGIKILSGEVKSEMLPVVLPRSIIGKINRLTFEVDRPGLFEFMSVNNYNLKDVILVKNYLAENNYEARQFVLSGIQMSELTSMSLLYRLNCLSLKQTGRIVVRLNGKLIHDTLAVCDAGVTEIDFNMMELLEGRNVLEFAVDKGQYVLENLVVEGDYSQEDFPRYDFVMQIPNMIAVLEGADVVLQARFPNDGLEKSGAFYINGYPIYFDTRLSEFTANLNGLVFEGKNVITIIPESTYEMLSLDVFLA
tara:strand:- start:4243 stop:5466 length:1224 start_codon:yes stop_codon:yes gene_type:complete